MFKKAKKYAEGQKPKIKIIATGEVLGERPMSQTSKSLALIDKEIGFELLRPLSAKLFPETEVEREKLVDRNKLLDISGRGRKKQFELAKKFGIKFPNPGGGCLLCEKAYKDRFKDFFINQNENSIITNELISTLINFRHFRNPQTNGKIILGRNHEENLKLEKFNRKLKLHIIIPKKPGPTAIYEAAKDKELAEQIVKAYSDSNLEQRKNFEKFRI